MSREALVSFYRQRERERERESERRKRSSAESLETVFILTTKIDHSPAALP